MLQLKMPEIIEVLETYGAGDPNLPQVPPLIGDKRRANSATHQMPSIVPNEPSQGSTHAKRLFVTRSGTARSGA